MLLRRCRPVRDSALSLINLITGPMSTLTRVSLFAALCALCIGLSLPVSAQAQATIGEQAPSFTLTDTDGDAHSLADYKGKYVVLEWLNFGCPFVGKHYGSGNMQALQATYRDKGVVWLSIVSSAKGKQGYYPLEEMKAQKAKHNGNMTAILMDASGTVGKAYGATVTPHMYVINPDGELIYKGGIDDKPTTDEADIEGATNYVRLALDQAMSGEEVETKRAQPYGCSVKYASN
jgi:glutathione peroxidase-family protein